MYIIKSDFANNLLSKNPHLQDYFNAHELQRLLENGILQINKQNPEVDLIPISDIETLNHVFQKYFIRSVGLERTDIQGETMDISPKFEGKDDKFIENPIILGGEYKSMEFVLSNAIKEKEIIGKVLMLVSDRPFFHEEARPEVIASIISKKNSLTREKETEITNIIKKHFAEIGSLNLSPTLKRAKMYLEIIDICKGTKYLEAFNKKLLSEDIADQDRLSLRCLIYQNTSYLATEEDFAKFSLNENRIDSNKYRIILAKTNPLTQDRAATVDTYKVLQETNEGKEGQIYNLCAQIPYAVRQYIEFNRHTSLKANVLKFGPALEISSTNFYDELARLIYTVRSVILEKEKVGKDVKADSLLEASNLPKEETPCKLTNSSFSEMPQALKTRKSMDRSHLTLNFSRQS